jgi:hypothetical protein
MGIKVDKKRTDSYIGTFNYGCADDMLQLNDLKAMVKNMNRMLKEEDMSYQFYVKLRGAGRKPVAKSDAVDAFIYRRR